MKSILYRWSLALRVLPLAAGVALVKYLFHLAGWEVISLNMLFSGLLAATVFLIGFLLSGVLQDYKESERLPGELAASIETLFDEGWIICCGKGAAQGREFLDHVTGLAGAVEDWLFQRIDFEALMARVAGLNEHFVALEAVTVPNYIARMKAEQTNLRRILTRIRVIRDTSFVSSGYTIAEITALLLIIGFVMARIDPFYESLFFVGIIAFLLLYMLQLIRDLDNPFEYFDGRKKSDEVSLTPLTDLRRRLDLRMTGGSGEAVSGR